MILIQIMLYSQLLWAATQNAIPDGFQPGGAGVPVSVITESQATRLFEKFSNAKEIPSQYFYEGCYARTTAMAKLAEDEGVELGRVYLHGVLRNFPLARPSQSLRFKWHVAPMVYVLKNGKPELYVFDLSLFKKPVPEAEWIAALQLPNQRPDEPPSKLTEHYYGSRFQFNTKDVEKKKTAWDKTDLEIATALNKEFKKYLDMGEEAPAGTEERVHSEVKATAK